MPVSQLEEEVNHLSRNVSFGLNILFVSNSRVARSTIESLDSLVNKEAIPISKVALLSSRPLSSSLEENFELSHCKFNQLFWPYSNGERDYSILSSLKNYDIIVVTSGVVSLTNNETNRLESFKNNYNIIKNIALNLKGYEGFVILTTNPVDYLAEEFVNISGISPYQIIGVHTENIRLRKLIAKKYNLLDYSLNRIRICTSSVHGNSILIKSSLALSYNNNFENLLDTDSVESLFDLVKRWPREVLSSNEHTQKSTSSAILEYINTVQNYKNSFINASVYMSNDLISKISKFDTPILNKVNHFNGWFSYLNVKINHSSDVRLDSPLFIIRSEPFDFHKISSSNKLSVEDKLNFTRAIGHSSDEYSFFKSQLSSDKSDKNNSGESIPDNFSFLKLNLFSDERSVFISQDVSLSYDYLSIDFYLNDYKHRVKIGKYLDRDYLTNGFKNSGVTSIIKLDNSSYIFSHSLIGLVYVNFRKDSSNVKTMFSCNKESLPCNLGGLIKFKRDILFYYGETLFKLRFNHLGNSDLSKSSLDVVHSFDERVSSTFVLKDNLFVSTKHYLFRFNSSFDILYYNPFVHIKGSSAFCDNDNCFASLLCKSHSQRSVCSFIYKNDKLSLVGRNDLSFPAKLITSFGKHFLVYSDSNYALFSYDDLGVSPILSG